MNVFWLATVRVVRFSQSCCECLYLVSVTMSMEALAAPHSSGMSVGLRGGREGGRQGRKRSMCGGCGGERGKEGKVWRGGEVMDKEGG